MSLAAERRSAPRSSGRLEESPSALRTKERPYRPPGNLQPYIYREQERPERLSHAMLVLTRDGGHFASR
ncbi:hypothetical protein SKAU_G00321370 [Synaphobranchus kaupii]|uniref:Uncharacterized protein n=1 Tax=Synaphobranchus kaupii TaxID=118154 RepID=A0A9Q1IJX8_SYNKA|nr:hypothetical protein SKAU_G00321370 [Synaphobranchus kaupii]